MILALDYDNTFTMDPDGWGEFCEAMRARGHRIYGVTMRYDHETRGISEKYRKSCDRIFFTGRRAKQTFMTERGVFIDVWIDDNPHWIMKDAAQ
jgi:hypothetical protein